jgi:hypothetical protein
MTRTWPCLHTARKTPATANRENIFLRASGPAFRQRSTHVLTHWASSSISVILSQATSSLSRSASGNVSELVLVASRSGSAESAGTGLKDVTGGMTGRELESGRDRGALSGCIELEIGLMDLTGRMTSYLPVHLILEHVNVFRRNPSLGTTCSVIRSYGS